MAPLPDPAVLDGAASVLSNAAGVLAARRRTAAARTSSTEWVSPAADRARLAWARADGAARTGAAELRVCAAHLRRLGDAIDDVAAAMAAAHRQAREDLLELRVPVDQGGRGLPGPLVEAELRSLRAPSDPYWAAGRTSVQLPMPSLPDPAPPADTPPPAPPGTVVTDPGPTRTLAAAWQEAGLDVEGARSRAATVVASLPLHDLDAYGLPGSRTRALLDAVVDRRGAAASAGDDYAAAAEQAVQAAHRIDGLGETFLTQVDGVYVGTATTAAQTVLDHFDLLDTAAQGGSRDGIVSLEDLAAAAADTSLPADVRAAAQALLDDDTYCQLVEDMNEYGYPGTPGDRLRASDLRAFLTLRRHAEALYGALPELIALSDHPNGTVTSAACAARSSRARCRRTSWRPPGGWSTTSTRSASWGWPRGSR